MTPLTLIFIILILCIVLAFIVLAAVIANIIVYGYRQSTEEAWSWQMDHAPGCRIFKRSDFTDYEVSAPDGYLHHVSYLPAKKPSDRYIILAHGYTDTRFGMLKYIQFYHALGFHCIAFDQRGHGENAPAPCSYSIREKTSLLAVLKDARERYGETIRVGIHGESLGGATVLASLGEKPDISFAVDDCGFCDIIPILKDGLRKSRVPRWMVYPASLAAKVLFGASFTAAKPIEGVRENHIPLLIIHGAEDDFIPPEHSARVKDANPGYAELHYFQGAGHAGSAIKDPEKYLEILRNFLTEIGFA